LDLVSDESGVRRKVRRHRVAVDIFAESSGLRLSHDCSPSVCATVEGNTPLPNLRLVERKDVLAMDAG
jgi:hypothetical protein